MVAPFGRSGLGHQVSGLSLDPADGDATMRQQNLSRLYRFYQLHRYLGPVSSTVLAEGVVPR